MERNMDLIREIMLAVESSKDPTDWVLPEVDGFNQIEISYHVMLLKQANYLDAIDLTSNDGYDWRAKTITWAGHEFLDSARDKKVWNTAKKSLGQRFATVSFGVLQSILVEIVKSELGLNSK